MGAAKEGVRRQCLFAYRQSARTTTTRFIVRQQCSSRSFTTALHPAGSKSRGPRAVVDRPPPRYRDTFPSAATVTRRTAATSTSTSTPDLQALNIRVHSLANTLPRPEDGPVPSEQRTLYVLEQLDSMAHTLLDAKSISHAKAARAAPNAKLNSMTSATSALLGSVNVRQSHAHVTKASLLNQISSTAEQILRDPNIFITPSILRIYVDLQAALHQPSSFPDVLALYASKPIPKVSATSPNQVTYSRTNPRKINAAVPSTTANNALTSALKAHDLPLSLDIIATTFATPAYRASKFVRLAAIPLAGLVLSPVAAYTLSTQLSHLQSTMSPSYATGVAFAGIMTYILSVGGVGYVAVTTANDQMVRVTWAQGVPLWERWMREEERAALDRVAGRWGFEKVERRGEEEGEEWEILREVCGVRGMVLDRAELMDGME